MTNLGLIYFVPEFLSVALLVGFLFKSILDGENESKPFFGKLALGAFFVGLSLFFAAHNQGTGFYGMISADSFSLYFKAFFCATFLIVLFMSRDFFARSGAARAQEFGMILWCAFIGLCFLASASHLLVLFISLEILTMSLYILAASGKYLSIEHTETPASVEAGLKYLMLGSISSGFLIFGIALLYLQIGVLSFSEIAAAKALLLNSRLGLLSLLFIFAGLGFKIAAFPFQLWVPDVYQGSPTPVAATLSVASKAAGFLLIIRFFGTVLGPLDERWKIALAALSLFTLFYGNIGALAQTSFKRLMGYSSIGHAGYLMLALIPGTIFSHAAILYYFLGYAASTLAVFYVITLVEKTEGSDALENFEGLSQSSPFLAGVLFAALLSLAGIPPFAGFMGKFWILLSTLQAGFGGVVLASSTMIVVGLYYYLSIALKMFFRQPRNQNIISIPFSSRLILIALTLLSLGFGLLQGAFLRISTSVIPASFVF